MRVSRLVHETDLVTSVYLSPVDVVCCQRPPGQYLTVRLAGAGEPAPVRSYSLSASTADSYRISVKRETMGWPAGTSSTTLAVGDDLDVAAPRGEFVLADGDEPVVLLSAGIGVTPVLSMLQALAARHSAREIWWLHTTSSRATHALAQEARRAAAVAARRTRHLLQRATGRQSRRMRVLGRLDRAVLAGLELPTEASVYLCGPVGFMETMTTALVDLGLARSRIHTETFASLSAINPGVVSDDRPAPHPLVPSREWADGHLHSGGRQRSFDESLASLLEMAEACDVPTRWSCRTGVCHTCATSLLSGDVAYVLKPLTAPEPGEVLLCCSRPASDVVLDL